MSDTLVIVRRSEPSELDIAPYGTRCKVFDHYDNYDLYLQVSYNDDDPTWDLVGNYTPKANQELLNELIEARLRKYSHSD